MQNHAVGGAVAVKHEDVPAENIVAAIQQGAQFFLTGSVANRSGTTANAICATES